MRAGSKDCAARLNFCPLGSGAVAGATLKLDRTIAARELGFTAPTANSMDATSDRDFALEFAQDAALLGIHISRFAEEITLFATSEFAFVDLPESFSTGSSAMPQKKNPDLTELLRGKCGRLAGACTTLTTLLKGLPLAYNKDLQETQEPVFEVADTTRGHVERSAWIYVRADFRFERMREAAQRGYLNAMAAATYLTGKGVPFRTAHEKVGNSVRYALEKGVELGRADARRAAPVWRGVRRGLLRRHRARRYFRLPRCDGRDRARTRAAGARSRTGAGCGAQEAQGWGGDSCWCVRHCCTMPPTCTTS